MLAPFNVCSPYFYVGVVDGARVGVGDGVRVGDGHCVDDGVGNGVDDGVGDGNRNRHYVDHSRTAASC